MGLRNIEIKRSYRTYDKNNNIVLDSFIKPCLNEAVLYQRSVGYFSSEVIRLLMDSLQVFRKKNGKVQLITTPMLSKKDIEAISLGYKLKESLISEVSFTQYKNELKKMDNDILIALAELIMEDVLDIKIVTLKSGGEYHDKLGILTDENEDKVVFFGSSNSSLNGYLYNYEKIRTARSWIESEEETVSDEYTEFESLWKNENDYVDVVNFTEAAKKGVLEETKERGIQLSNDKNVVALRDYQVKAIEAWKNNNYNGFFVMATGTGKTFTAIYGLKELVKENKRIIVICAPYKHLLRQWCDDLEKVFINAQIVMCSSENNRWTQELTEAIIAMEYGEISQLIVVSTIKSFMTEKFEKIINKSKIKKVLVVDEAHRFTNRPLTIKKQYINMLGLSATPTNGKNKEEGKSLVNYFGGVVFNLPIEKALEDGYLVPYNYYPIYVDSTEDEDEEFFDISIQMASCFKNNICIDKDKLQRLSRKRLRRLASAEQKINRIDEFVDSIKEQEQDHVIVYCGDSQLFPEQDNIRYINYVKRILNAKGFMASQFTASENMNERMRLIELFNKGIISSLAAIRCLDEGINIPSIKAALILASNDDLKEFVQRRGRILRRYKNKEIANIYDVVVLPSVSLKNVAKIELRRVWEYARLASNFEVLEDELNEYISRYGLSIEELMIEEDYLEEDVGDE